MDSANRNERTEAKQPGQHRHISGENTCLEILRVSSGARDYAVRVQCIGPRQLYSEWMLLIEKSTSEPWPRKPGSRRHGCTARTSYAVSSCVRARPRLTLLIQLQRHGIDSAPLGRI